MEMMVAGGASERHWVPVAVALLKRKRMKKRENNNTKHTIKKDD